MIDRLHPVAATVPVSSTMTIAQVQQNRASEARNQAVRRAVGVKLRVARAVLALSHNDYQRAARELGEVGEDGGLEEWDGEAISTPDVAFLCAMCTLATGSREHIRRVIVDRASFHAALGDHQGWVMDLVRAFVDARYGEALTLLRKAEVSFHVAGTKLTRRHSWC
jgi:COP9 signalosome complex subunit 1